MFNENDYEKVLKTISIEKANKVGLLLFVPVFIVFTGLYFILWKEKLIQSFQDESYVVAMIKNTGLFFLAFIIGIVLHELIHGISFALFAPKGIRSIRFGVLWQYLTPYCHCTEPLQIKHYIFGALTPAVILGLIPAIVGLVIGSYLVTFLGITFIVAAVGDFMVVQLLWNEKGTDYAQDHPSEAGCFVFRKKMTDDG